MAVAITREREHAAAIVTGAERTTTTRTMNTYAYVGGNPISIVHPLGLDSRSQIGGIIYGLARANGPRAPDFVQFSVDMYVFNASGAFSRSGNSFAGGGINRQLPNPMSVGASITLGYLNQLA